MDIKICIVKFNKQDLVMGQTVDFYKDHAFLTTSVSQAKQNILDVHWDRVRNFTIIEALVSINTLLDFASLCIHGDSFRNAKAKVISIEYLETQ